MVRLNPVNGDLVEKREDLKGNVLRVERMASMTADQSHPLLVIRLVFIQLLFFLLIKVNSMIN